MSRTAAVPPDVSARVAAALAGPVRRATKRKRALPQAAIDDIKLGALHHPDLQMRRWCLFLLDHYANDQSTAVFAAALTDEQPLIRDLGLHGIACEPCKQGELCVADTVPHIIRVLQTDPSVSLRIKAIATLLALAGRDSRASEAIAEAARSDRDPLVRQCAREAREGRFVPPKKRYERSQRRHAAVHH